MRPCGAIVSVLSVIRGVRLIYEYSNPGFNYP
jgi:hypothetical protein